MDVEAEIEPEPSDDERAAILAALALERGDEEPGGGWPDERILTEEP